MRITLTQLSDIHLSEGPNWVADKVDKIAGAARADDPTTVTHVLAFSGDIAYSGKEGEYAKARLFVGDLQRALVGRGEASVLTVFIPGNHDCDFDRETDTRKMALNHIAAELSGLDLSGNLVRQFLSVQDPFYTFAAALSAMPALSDSDRLFHVEDYDLNGFLLRFNLYNTAWLSRRHEKQGELLFPAHIVEPKLASRRPAQLTISMLHHPYNWLAATNGRELRRIIETTSDVVLTGHEHESSAYTKDLFPSGSLQYFEGAVLQGDASDTSGFNVLHVDTSVAVSRASVFLWKSGMYQTGTAADWEPLNRNEFLTGSTFANKLEYEQHLQDIGTGFTHPHFKGDLTREHLFVYPDLIRRSLHKRHGTNSNAPHVVESKEVLSVIWESKRTLVAGSDLSGKTTMAKSLYTDIKNRYGAIPLLISGAGLRATNDTEVRRLLDAAITEQYGTAQREAFHQLTNDRKVLIIDDFDHCALSPKGQGLFLDTLRPQFDRIVILADEFFALEELSHETNAKRVFHDFENFDIREFGYYLRGKLIEKWVALGREHMISKVDLDHEVSGHEQLISTLLGRNLLPSHPLIILTVLQAWESTQTHDIATGSYGYLYEMLILQALSRVGFRAPEIDVTMTFLARVAHKMFVDDREELTDAALRQLSTEYFEYYRTRLPDDLFNKLNTARVLSQTGSDYSFRYPYYYYFFVARYLRDNMNVEDERGRLAELVREMADHIHYERYANVLGFYIYLTKDTRAIGVILENARLIYDEFEPCDFDHGVQFYNQLYVQQNPNEQLQLPTDTPDANRDRYRKELDRARDEEDGQENTAIQGQRRSEKLRYSKQLADIVKVNIANKTLQIMGQVIRNSPGSLPGSVKREVAREAYRLGLRTLTAVLNVPISNLEGLRRYLVGLVREYRASRRMPELLESEMWKIADEGIIHLAQAFGFGMIRRISQAVGLKQLEETYAEVLKDNADQTSVRLVDVAIKLDHFPTAPISAIKELDDSLQRESNYYSHNVLLDLVYCYLYIRNVDYKTRSQLMSWFNISGGATKTLVDNPSKRERRGVN